MGPQPHILATSWFRSLGKTHLMKRRDHGDGLLTRSGVHPTLRLARSAHTSNGRWVGAIGRAVNFDWTAQPVLEGARGPSSTGTALSARVLALATSSAGWEHLRFEVTEDPTPRSDGGRWLHTPDLGIHYAQTDAAGNIVIGRGPDPLRDGDRRGQCDRVAARAGHRARGPPGRGTGAGSGTRATTPESSGSTKSASRHHRPGAGEA